MKEIQPTQMPAPAGHYSHAVAHAGVLYVSGQLGRSAGMSDAEAGDLGAQTRRALSCIQAILQAAGTDFSRVMKINVYLGHIDLWPEFNGHYADFMGRHRPARAIIPTGALHHGALVEIDAIAALSLPE